MAGGHEIIYNKLVADGITDPIFYELADDGQDRPYIVIMQDATEPHNTHNGASSFDRVQCRVLTFGDRLITGSGIVGAKTLADTVRTSLDFYQDQGVKEVYFQNEQTESIENSGNKRAYMIEQLYDVWINR